MTELLPGRFRRLILQVLWVLTFLSVTMPSLPRKQVSSQERACGDREFGGGFRSPDYCDLRPQASARKVWTSRRARVRVPAITARPLWYGLD